MILGVEKVLRPFICWLQVTRVSLIPLPALSLGTVILSTDDFEWYIVDCVNSVRIFRFITSKSVCVHLTTPNENWSAKIAWFLMVVTRFLEFSLLFRSAKYPAVWGSAKESDKANSLEILHDSSELAALSLCYIRYWNEVQFEPGWRVYGPINLMNWVPYTT